MKYRAFLAATAIVVSSFNTVMVTPAFAVEPTVDPQQFCEDQLKPNDPNSEFQTEPVGLIEGPGPMMVRPIPTRIIPSAIRRVMARRPIRTSS